MAARRNQIDDGVVFERQARQEVAVFEAQLHSPYRKVRFHFANRNWVNSVLIVAFPDKKNAYVKIYEYPCEILRSATEMWLSRHAIETRNLL